MSAGFLDPKFGTNGIVINSLDYDYITIQSVKSQNNKIIVAGRYTTDDDYVFLARYNLNGTVDTTFGTNGFIMTNYIANTDDNSDIMIVQSTNKIIILCKINLNFGLVRYTENGVLDTTFDTDGIVDTGHTFNSSLFCSIKKQQSTDNFVICIFNIPNDEKWCLKRFNSNVVAIGTLIETVFNNSVNNRWCLCNTIDKDGNMILAGRVSGGGGGAVNNPNIYAVYNSSGVLNTAIGTGGIVSYTGAVIGNFGYNSVVTDGDNNIYLVADHNPKLLLNKYNTLGVLIDTDINITGNGTNTTLYLENNSKIIISTINQNDDDFNESYIIKVNSNDFSIDTDFGTNGQTITKISEYSIFTTRIVVIDERIIVVGYIEDNNEFGEYLIMSFYKNHLINNLTFCNLINNNVNNNDKFLLYNIQELGSDNTIISTEAANLISQILN